MMKRRFCLLLILLLGGFTFARAETVEGELQIVVEDHFDNTAVTRYFLKTANELLQLSLHDIQSLGSLRNGDKLQLSGRRTVGPGGFSISAVGQASAFSASSVHVLGAGNPNHSIGIFKVLVLLINFQDDANQTYTVPAAQAVMNTVNNYYKEVSFNQTSLASDVFGVYTVAGNATCGPLQLALDAAAAHGINADNYDKLVIIFPRQNCGEWIGQNGGYYSLINGAQSWSVIAHELGHSFALTHSHTLDCGGVPYNHDSGCSVSEYGDPYDVMATANGHFNAFEKDVLQWINPQTVTSSGDYTLEQLETPGTGVKGLTLTLTHGSLQRYYYMLEYRQPIGFDAGISANVANGVMFHVLDARGYSLLKMNPANSFRDPALGIGQTYTDPEHGISFTPISKTATSITVRIIVPDGEIPVDTGDTTAPSVSLTTPLDGAIVSEVTPVSASASDNVAVSRIDFYVDGLIRNTDTTAPYSFLWNSATVANGSHSLQAKAYDGAGNMGASSVITITSDNDPAAVVAPIKEKTIFYPNAEPIVLHCTNTIEVYTRSGERITSLPCAGGEATWNAQTGAGLAASGIYLAGETGREARRFIIVK